MVKKQKSYNSYFVIRNSGRPRGFTLIELLVVISIIGLVLGLSLFGLIGARESARDAKRKSDLEAVRSGLELYKADCKRYPTSDIFASSSLTGDSSLNLGSCSPTNIYIAQMPQDPTSPSRAYKYVSVTNGVSYEICASLEKGGSTITCGSSQSCGSQPCNYKATNP